MVSQLDWVGGSADISPKAFKDIRNQRPSKAEEKARLYLRPGELINQIPPAIKHGGSVNLVREWRVAREVCAKVAGSSRSSEQELTASIGRMEKFFNEAST
jgi:hypothetical protein